MNSFIITIDQGSSATKILAFDHQDHQSYRSFRSLKIERPRPGYVEQDTALVLRETRAALDEEIFYPKISLPQRKALSDRWHELLKIKGILS